jgi:hypothetical protein
MRRVLTRFRGGELFSNWAEITDVKLAPMLLCHKWNKMIKRCVWDRVGLRQSVVVCFCFILLACASQMDATVAGSQQRAEEIATTEIAMKPTIPVTFRSVGKGYRSGVRAPLQIVARSQNEWTALWRQHASGDSSSRPPPAIDFEKEVVVALFLGERPTGGYDVQISRAEQTNDGLTIYYREKDPPLGGMVIQALTQPFHIVRIIGEVNSVVIFRRES